MNNKTRLYLIDDHKMFADGLKSVIESKERYEVIGMFSEAERALEKYPYEKPEVVICDISMPKMNGIDFTKKLLEVNAQAKVLIVSMHSGEAYINESLKAGVKGYIPKDSSVEEVHNALDLIQSENIYVSPIISSIMLKKVSDKIVITQREIEVVNAISLGLNTIQIADKLNVSVHTIESHRKNLLAKTGCLNAVDLTMWGVKNGYIEI